MTVCQLHNILETLNTLKMFEYCVFYENNKVLYLSFTSVPFKNQVFSLTEENLGKKTSKINIPVCFLHNLNDFFVCSWVEWNYNKIYKSLPQSVACELSKIMLICVSSSEINNSSSHY